MHEVGEKLAALESKLDQIAARLDMPEQRYFGIEGAAQFSALSEKSIRRLLANGTLTAHRPVRGRIVIDARELESVIRATAQRRIVGGRGQRRQTA